MSDPVASRLDGYFINLDQSEQRRLQMAQHLASLGIGWVHRHAGTAGLQLPAPYPAFARDLTPGQYGCYLSHQAVLAASDPSSFTLVLEDDAELSLDFSHTIHPAQLGAMAEVDIVFLSCLSTLHGAAAIYRVTTLMRRERADAANAANAESEGDPAGQGEDEFRITGAQLLPAQGNYDCSLVAYIVTPRGKRNIARFLAETEASAEAMPAVDLLYRDAINSGRLQGLVIAPFLASPRLELPENSTIGYQWEPRTLRWLILRGVLSRLCFAGPMGDLRARAAPHLQWSSAEGELTRDALQRKILFELLMLESG